MDHNWIGVCPVDSTISQDYAWIKRDGDDIVEVHNKKQSDSAVDAFIGLMYCKDDTYLNNLMKIKAKETYEGFSELPLKAHTVKNWLDFGTYEKWHKINEQLPEISFPKPDELFYCDNDKVIKYFTDQKNVSNRVLRAQSNPECMPSNVTSMNNFLIHDFAKGNIIYDQITPSLFKKMLDWCEKTLWIKSVKECDTYSVCDSFYRKKTIERVNQFRIKYADWSEFVSVNGEPVESIDFYLNKIDWENLSTIVDWRFIHGDLHFDNVVYDINEDKFTAIDWRTDFAGQIYGDLYYDLAKMLGGILLNYKSIKNNLFQYEENNNHAIISIPSVLNFENYENILKLINR
jgi:hypothetical protein